MYERESKGVYRLFGVRSRVLVAVVERLKFAIVMGWLIIVYLSLLLKGIYYRCLFRLLAGSPGVEFFAPWVNHLSTFWPISLEKPIEMNVFYVFDSPRGAALKPALVNPFISIDTIPGDIRFLLWKLILLILYLCLWQLRTDLPQLKYSDLDYCSGPSSSLSFDYI